jgi:integrase
MFKLGLRCTPPKVRVVPYIPLLRENNVRKGFLEDAEFSRLTAKTSELWMRTFLELAYTYGWRRGELLGLRVRQVNLATAKIRLDAGTTKNSEGREVAMTGKVAELLRQAIVGKGPEEYVLTRTNKKEQRHPVRSFRKAWQKMVIAAGLGGYLCAACSEPWQNKSCVCGGRKRKYKGLIVHDLRRSAAKELRRAGVPESVIMATGGWKTAAMFRRYAIVSNKDQLAAVAALERKREEVSPRLAPISENQLKTENAKLQ